MSRKTKIIMVAAFALLGVAVISTFQSGGKGEVRVSYVGLSPTNSSFVVFAMTNTARKSFNYAEGVSFLTNRLVEFKDLWGSPSVLFTGLPATIPPGSSTTFIVPVMSSARWSSLVLYAEPPTTNSITTTRVRLTKWAAAHQWLRVAKLLRPGSSWKIAYGPAMSDDKPMAAVPK